MFLCDIHGDCLNFSFHRQNIGQSARRDSRFARFAAIGLGLCVPLAGVETTLVLAIVLVIVQLVMNQGPSRPVEPPESPG